MSRVSCNIEERINNIQKAYDAVDTLFDKLPNGFGNKYIKLIKDELLNNRELEELIKSLEEYRPPRILIVGRTGFGKSSLINSMFDAYVAEVSDVSSCTRGTMTYSCRHDGGVPLEIMDTRGIAESEAIDDSISAEEQILADIEKFNPDVALLVLSCVSRDGIDNDIEFIKAVKRKCYEKDAIDLPVVVAVNKADCVTPTRETVPFNEEKLQNINLISENISRLCEKHKLATSDIIAVSSCIDWKTPDGNEIKTSDKLNQLSDSERAGLMVSFDGRYNIDRLKDVLENSVTDADANTGIRMAFHLDEMIAATAERFVNIFAAMAASVAAVSLPVAHYFVLVTLEVILVCLIMALSGRDADFESGKEFIAGLCGVAGAGKAFSQVADVLVKFIKGPGDIISAAVAASGMKMIGKAAIEYFIKGYDLETVQRHFRLGGKMNKAREHARKAASDAFKLTSKSVEKAGRGFEHIRKKKKRR